MGIAQSSVSARITALENKLGTQLFERGRQGATPTSAGVRFEEHARLILASWQHAQRDVGQQYGSANVLCLSGQFSLMRPILVDWAIKHRADTNQAIDLQADYSNQIVRDLLSGVVDIGLLYSPKILADLTIHQEGTQVFQMVSSDSLVLEDVNAQTYVKTGYTDYFVRTHDELLPHLSFAPIATGNEAMSIELLKQLGGTSYIPIEQAKLLCEENSEFKFVQDAPQIPLAIYSAVHVRRRHDATIAQALSSLRDILNATQLADW
jgi:DNA-binding transcriptional LysR family regulator